jgi:hypothetical protein
VDPVINRFVPVVMVDVSAASSHNTSPFVTGIVLAISLLSY